MHLISGIVGPGLHVTHKCVFRVGGIVSSIFVKEDQSKSRQARQDFRFAWQEDYVDFCLVLHFAMFVLFALMFFDPSVF